MSCGMNSGLGREKPAFRELLTSTPIPTAAMTITAECRKPETARNPAAPTTTMVRTLVLPSAVMSRIASLSHAGPTRSDGLSAARSTRSPPAHGHRQGTGPAIVSRVPGPAGLQDHDLHDRAREGTSGRERRL